MNVEKITPVLFVDEIESCLEFWVERLGFERTMEVPDGPKPGFVLLSKGHLEIMYQTFASQRQDNPTLADEFRRGPTFLYIEVSRLDTVIDAMHDFQVFLPVRTTFYGTREVGYKDPAGHLVVFAEPIAAS